MGRTTAPMSLAETRRLALAAQGFARSRPAGRVDARQLRRVIDQLCVLQLDPVNVVCRSHYLPVFARLGPYPRQSIDQMSWGTPSDRALFEYWDIRRPCCRCACSRCCGGGCRRRSARSGAATSGNGAAGWNRA